MNDQHNGEYTNNETKQQNRTEAGEEGQTFSFSTARQTNIYTVFHEAKCIASKSYVHGMNWCICRIQ